MCSISRFVGIAFASILALLACSCGDNSPKARVSASAMDVLQAYQERDERAFIEAAIEHCRTAVECIKEMKAQLKDERQPLDLVDSIDLAERYHRMFREFGAEAAKADGALADNAWLNEVAKKEPEGWKQYQKERVRLVLLAL